MKIAYCSDLHLEFHGRNFDFPDADVLLLAGDICEVNRVCDMFTSGNHRQFFIDASAKYKNVIWIAGNHEYYDGCINTAINLANEFFKDEGITNIIFSDMGSCIIEDVKFVYATLWTDINKGNPVDITAGRSIMADYKYIMKFDDTFESGIRYLSPYDTVLMHDAHKSFITQEVKGFDKVVVMTHHAPNMLSDIKHIGKNSAYFYCCTDMDDLILDNPQISHWIAGHTHAQCSYQIGDTEVMSNCRGYDTESIAKNFKIQVFDV